MFVSTEEIVSQIQDLHKEFQFLISYEIEERTLSILKAKIFFNEKLFIQLYMNIRKSKINYSLIMNDIRLYGRDFLWGKWHRHPFNSAEIHDKSEEGQTEVSLREFFLEVLRFLGKEDLL